MRRRFDAVFENGVFRLVGSQDTGLCDGEKVTIVVETRDAPVARTAEDWLAQAAKVCEGLSEEEIDEIERIAIGDPRPPGECHE